MDLYLPIAGLSVNALVIIGLGGLVGLLTGMVGVGGGFLTTPILIFYGIPPAVAVASATTQITGTSISGVLAHRPPPPGGGSSGGGGGGDPGAAGPPRPPAPPSPPCPRIPARSIPSSRSS